MAITIDVDGIQYTKFLKLQLELQLDAVSNSFSIEVATSNEEPLPFQGGESCVLFIDGVKKLTGFLEVAAPSYDAESHSVVFSGRDNTSALVDSSLLATKDITPPISLKAICETVIEQIGANITVSEGTTIDLFNQAEDLIAIESGDNAFEFLQKLANKRQVLLSSDAEGNLLLTQGSPTSSFGRLQNLLDGNDNNVITASANFDTTQRYNQYIVVSQLNPTATNFAGSTSAESMVSAKGLAVDTEIRDGRQLVIRASTSSSNEQCLKRAQWELNMRKARGTTYQAEVSGHTIADAESEIWDINTLIQVADQFSGIFADMLVNKVTFVTSLAGNDTTLELIPKDSYTLTISEPINTVSKVATGIFKFP